MKRKRINTYFRQTSKAFGALRQTRTYYHINRNITHAINKYSLKNIPKKVLGANENFLKSNKKLLDKMRKGGGNK